MVKNTDNLIKNKTEGFEEEKSKLYQYVR